MAENKLTISIISFNTLGVPFISKDLTERYVALAQLIQQTDANILAFQEVHTYIHLLILKKFLPDFPHVKYEKFLYGPKGGVVTFSKLPFESIRFTKFTSHGSLRNITFYARLIRNGTLICKLDNYPIYILNTYLTTTPGEDWEKGNVQAKLKEQQIRDIAEIVNALKADGQTVIIAGDFNIAKESPGYAMFTKLTAVHDTFDTSSLPTYILNSKLYIFNSKKSRRLDYIFFIKGNNKIKIKKTDHIFDEKVRLMWGKKSYLSDHIGLYAKMEFPSLN